MRPDEHKKKKNAQYKKKHGISEKENKQKDDTKNKTNVQDQKVKQLNAKGAESRDVCHSDKSKVKVEETEDVNKHFGKRKIESNWSRYEEDSDSEIEDDLPLQRGEDFNKLLAQAGGSATQFRLKDEKDWNDESGDSAPALALDIDNLSQSLDCIPLHERLGIKENLFTEEQLNEMKAYSANIEQKYGPTRHKVVNQNRSKKAGPDSSSTVSSAIDNNVTDKTSENKANITNITTANGKPRSEDSNEIKNEPKKEFKKPVRNIEVASLEDDLDMILSIEDTKDKTPNIVNKAVLNGQRKSPEMGTAKNDLKISNKSKKKGNESKGNENLEDWLDSMLDD